MPHHRVMGMYLYDREASGTGGFFMGDHENEFLFMGEGLTSYDLGTISTQKDADSSWKKVQVVP